MKNDSDYILNDMLAEWHRWASGYKVVAGHGTSAMFSGVRSSRQWDDSSEVAEGSLHNDEMQALDFNIGELCLLFQTALRLQARNLATGIHVWNSARLPQDRDERVKVLIDARNALRARME